MCASENREARCEDRTAGVAVAVVVVVRCVEQGGGVGCAVGERMAMSASPLLGSVSGETDILCDFQ